MGLRVTRHPKTGIFQISGTLGGERIRTSARTGDYQAAQQAAKAIEREYWQSRASGKRELVPFEDAVASYEMAGGDTRFTDRVALHFAGVPVGDIKPGHIRDAARKLYPEAKPATRNRQVIVPVRAIINHAAERGWCPPIRVKRFDEEQPRRQAVDRDWIDAFMAHASPELAALALFMFTTGARISDALSLTWDNIQDRRARIETKTGAREAVLSREMVACLSGLAGQRPFGFKSKSGHLYRQWYETCDLAGIPRVPPHQAGRHSFATEMIIRKGKDAQTTAKLGGWASTRMLDRYAHPEALEDTVDEVFGKSRPTVKKLASDPEK